MDSSSQPTHYALVNGGSSPLAIPSDEDLSYADSGSDPRKELTTLYQQYAELYPNPRLVEEYRLRNTLLQAASAAATAQGVNQKSKKGFFARLFGSDDQQQQQQQTHTPDAPLVYTDVVNDNDDGSLCGTMQSLDRSCIPLEAYSVARFHLTSRRTRGDHPNAVRWGPLLGRATPTSLIVVGLGIIAEMQPNKPSSIRATSDQHELYNYSNSHPGEFRLEYARACGISPNCVAVSWGFQDGLIVMYRRIEIKDQTTSDLVTGWEQMWIIGPSPAVLDAIGDLFHDDESHPGSPLLRVADLLPLRVSTGDRRQPMVTSLAIARLGGYLELIPVPSNLWFGPTLTPETYRRPKNPKPRQGQHYALGKRIACPAISLTTADYHLDILAMDALRTSVGLETEWNNQAFPDAPPSEYIVAVSGRSVLTPGSECISFWSVCTLFSESETETAPIGFELHSSLLETTTLESGADVSIFASNEILQHWRLPRQVALRHDASLTSDSNSESGNDWSTRITTISTPAPIVQMQFLDQKGSAFLAVVDWNGATTIFDCAPMERTASQSLSWSELARLELNDGKKIKPAMHRTIVSRTQFANAIGRRNEVGTLQWLKAGTGDEGNYDMEHLCPLVILLRNEKTLLLVTFRFRDEDGQVVEPTGSVLSLPFPGRGVSMGDVGSGNMLVLCKQRHGQGSILLKVFVMQHLQPEAIVESLAREQKYAEAIATARNLDELDQAALADVIEECHRRIWETKRDINSLADTRNITYIVEQTIGAFESSLGEDLLPLDQLRALCQLAKSVGRNHRTVNESLNQVDASLIRLGTYELLCQYFSTPVELKKFFNDFQKTSVVELAKAIAMRGDILGLSIVLFRHRAELAHDVFGVLEAIPISIHPEDYVHLLPMLKAGHIMDTYLPATYHDGAAVHLSHMPQYIKDTTSVAIVIDAADEKLVLEHNARVGANRAPSDMISKAPQWFADRSTKMQHFTGNMECATLLCEIGLLCNGYRLDKAQPLDQEIQPLVRTWRNAASLQAILLDDFVSFTGEESKDSASIIISTEDLLSMGLAELVDLILRGESSYSKIFARFTDYLQPLLFDIHDEMGASGKGYDDDLVSYCSGLADDCLRLSRQEASIEKKLKFVSRTLGTAAAIAMSSKSSIRKQDRLIKDMITLIQLVLGVIKTVSLALDGLELDFRKLDELFNPIWTMYEALPSQIPSSMKSKEKYLPLLQDLDKLYMDLICSDVLSRWPGSRPFSFLSKRFQEDFMSTPGVITDVVERLCKAYLANLHHLRKREKAIMLLQDLLSDIQHLAASCCPDSLSLTRSLCTHVVRPLLDLENFHLVIEYCNIAGPLVDKEQVKDAVLGYVDEAVFSENDDGKKVMSAMKCQDIIGPVFPDLQPAFFSIRRYLDASHFISTVIHEGRAPRPFLPAELRKQLPIDVLESILQETPQSVLCGCPQWHDEEYAMSANETLRILATSKSPDTEVPNELPVLPGGAVFHLATILGLEDDNAALVVKSRVIHYAVSVGLHGAAAAICRTMLGTESQGFPTDAMAATTLGAVAEIVSIEQYGDLFTKLELCQASLMRYSGQIDVLGSAAFNAICTASSNLDHITSRHNRAQRSISPKRLERLLTRPYSRLHKDIQAEYNADVHGLFSDLIIQTTNGVVHDSLMNALSRFVIYWCVSDSKTVRHQRAMSELNDARANLALGSSLILQIPSKLTAGNCVHELQKIAADQAASVSTEERFGKDKDICIPDADIVKRMIGRGYAENAARRSVVMTRNAGYDEALRWAVTHALDPDFDAPIVIVRNQSKKFIDEDSIQLLQKTLHAVQGWLDDSEEREGLLTFLTTMREGHIHHNGQLSEARKKGQPLGSSKKRATSTRAPVLSPIPAISPTPPLSPCPACSPRRAEAVKRSEKQEVVTNYSPVAANLKANSNKTTIEPEEKSEPTINSSGPSPIPSLSKLTTIRPTPVLTAGPTTNTPTLSIPKSTTLRTTISGTVRDGAAKPTLPSSTPIGAGKGDVSARVTRTLPSASPGTRDANQRRSELLNRRPVALQSKGRSHGETTDRQRLIAEGRELLRKARTAKALEGTSTESRKPSLAAKSTSATTVGAESMTDDIPTLAAEGVESNGANGVVSTIEENNNTNNNNSGGSGWDFDNFDEM